MAQEREKELARTDYLTGAANKRAFCELLALEISRSRRYQRPFTVIYSDVDNFKSVNDQGGHSAGDALLQELVATLKREARGTDTIGRLGGDEFALLLPETDQTGAEFLAGRLHQRLGVTMAAHGWPVSCSFGVLTCLVPPATVDDLLHLADRLMYAVKQNGKNGIKHQVLIAEPLSDQKS